MHKIEIIEEKVKTAVKLIEKLREENVKIKENINKLIKENEFLQTENKDVRKIALELSNLKEERALIKQKLEKLVQRYHKMKL
ncbi:MAG: hypothetical protein A3I11_04065 [Elusimicrobia bacterium RIFCSPLOWO2_02_FULL_39_32]|nr:MAG: hypothetical protein A2034_07480 [Elusimicrobia bacterium GWA2_38_7]OGR79551.1 MAG: hypothetical protein A3B80_02640 [Elusimicrobia bacterium RIFCSPHIGHO2_02_FULL_39_36]OGR92877.1 MAG: hypothetical protein A3I11_04065 [Elusimicrobia bacterium RIFCSPLOWO2_02_FULL_39_32]OGR99661.1 MAG: hypothetical protein A3G85_01430 [Elusimicrobia bacterium RIFCSPLOWO2_12_FULL_39_28]